MAVGRGTGAIARADSGRARVARASRAKSNWALAREGPVLTDVEGFVSGHGFRRAE